MSRIRSGASSSGGAGDILPDATVANSVLQRTYPPGTGDPFFAPLTLDQILPAFTITSFAKTGGTLFRVGQTVATPAFTASYNRPPAAAALTDNDGNPSTNVIGTPTSFASAFSYVKTTIGQTVTWSLTANETGGPSKVSPVVGTWGADFWYGNAVIPGSYTEAFIEGLSGNLIATSRARTIFVTAGAGEKIFVVLPSSFGTPVFSVGGNPGGFSNVATVSVTNAFGQTFNYDLWESNNVGLGGSTVVIT